MAAYVVEDRQPVTVSGAGVLAGMDLMSPFVWRGDGAYRMMLRAVPDPLGQTDPTGIVYCGSSRDGLSFSMSPDPALAPGPDFVDGGGVEDPTVEVAADGTLMVYYTGVAADRSQGALLVATGVTTQTLTKRAVMLRAPDGEGNIKEATVARAADGSWRLFYEYAAGGASRIGMARAPELGGEWQVLPDPFGIREGSWDNWHLSTGPIVRVGERNPVMFYNGATVDARWRIGWVSFAPDFSHVTGRGVEPILVPPPVADRSATDIAFAASALVEEGGISLWYSLEDRLLMRARIAVYDDPVRV